MRKRFVNSLAASLFLTCAFAANPVSSETVASADPMVAYTAYNTAIEQGNIGEASRHAMTAWQAAEAAWGNTNPNTAGLAYNAAWSSALAGTPSLGLPAALRAVELIELGKDAYAPDEARFLLANAQFFARDANDRRSEAQALAEAALPLLGKTNDLLVGDGLIAASLAYATPGRGRNAVKYADQALAEYVRLVPSMTEKRALALLARARGHLSQRSETADALSDVIDARIAYGKERSKDDKAWGALRAWHMAILAVFESSSNPNSVPTGSNIARGGTDRKRTLSSDENILISGPNFDCSSSKRLENVGVEVRYPSEAVVDSRVAGLVIRADMKPDGGLENLRVMGAVPDKGFAETAVQAISTWRYSLDSTTPQQCLKDRDIEVVYVLAN